MLSKDLETTLNDAFKRPRNTTNVVVHASIGRVE